MFAVFVESCGLLTYFAVFHDLYSKKEIKIRIQDNLYLKPDAPKIKTGNGFGDLQWADQVEVLHPYFGFSRDPDKNVGMTDQGFPSYHKKQIVKKSYDKINIAIFGGSFAKETYFLAIDQLKRCFSAGNRQVQVFNFSIGGYKQPQQLMVLNYLLAIGAQFDVVINIDGFNEVALPYVENVKLGVSPYYPRNWANRAKDLNNPLVVRLIGKIEVLKDQKRALAQFVKMHKLYRSPTLSLLWRLWDNNLNSKISETRADLQTMAQKGLGFTVHGPEYHNSSSTGLYRDLADIWMRCSLSMYFLCKSHHIRYFHFLQPNQYVPDSKRLSFKEKKTAYNHDHPYRDGVKNGYPELRKRGAVLIQNNVRFCDLTDIFTDNDATLYKDTCCHLNEQGYQLIVEKMCEYIRKQSG